MAQPLSSKPVILVVEDEPIQRMDMVDMAERAGFDVVEAYDADRAITILEDRADIRLVLADIDMPGTMNGLKLGAFVRRRWPPIAIILTTAGRPPPATDMPADAEFIAKPINYQRVSDMLWRMAGHVS